MEDAWQGSLIHSFIIHIFTAVSNWQLLCKAVSFVVSPSSFIAKAISCQSPELQQAACVVERAERSVWKLQGRLHHTAR